MSAAEDPGFARGLALGRLHEEGLFCCPQLQKLTEHRTGVDWWDCVGGKEEDDEQLRIEVVGASVGCGQHTMMHPILREIHSVVSRAINVVTQTF